MNGWLEIVGMVFGGTLIGFIIAIATLRSTIKKAAAEAEKAKAEAEKAKAEVEKMKAEIAQMTSDNDKSVMETFREFIVEPLQTEIKGLRRDVKNLRKAINTANNCPHSDNCPVLDELQNQSDDDCGKKRGPHGADTERDPHD